MKTQRRKIIPTKWIAILTCLLIVVSFVSVFYLRHLLDTDRLRQELTLIFNQQYGLNVQWQGELSGSVLPRPRIDTGPFVLQSLSDAKPVVAVDNLQLGFELLSALFFSDLQLDEVVLDHPRWVSAASVNQLFRPHDQQATSLTAAGSPFVDTRKPARTWLNRVDGIRLLVRRGEIIFPGLSSDKEFKLDKLELQTTALMAGVSAHLSASFELSREQQSPMMVEIHSDVDVRNSGIVYLGALELVGRTGDQEFSARAADVRYTPKRKYVGIAELLLNIRLDGNEIEGQLNHLGFNLEAGILDSELWEVRLKTAGSPLLLQAPGVLMDMLQQRIEIPEIRGQFAELPFNSSLLVRNFFDEPHISGRFTVPPFRPPDTAWLISEIAPVDNWQSVSISGSFQGVGNSLHLTDLQGQLDDSEFLGTLSVIEAGQRQLQFDLLIDQIDLDRYEKLKKFLTDNRIFHPLGLSQVAVELHELSTNQDITGRLQVGSIKYNGATLSRYELGLQIRQDRIRLIPYAYGVFGGQIDGDVLLQSQPTSSKLRMQQHWQGIDVEKFLAQQMGQSPLSGTINSNAVLYLDAPGDTGQVGWQSLRGVVEFELSGGNIYGLDLGNLSSSADTLQNFNWFATNYLPFDQIRGQLDIAKGIARSKILSLRGPGWRMTGAGSVDIKSGKLDYQMILKPDASSGVKNLNDRKRMTARKIPLRIMGSVFQPRIIFVVDADGK